MVYERATLTIILTVTVQVKVIVPVSVALKSCTVNVTANVKVIITKIIIEWNVKVKQAHPRIPDFIFIHCTESPRLTHDPGF